MSLYILDREVEIIGRVLTEPLRRDSFAYDKPKKFPPFRIYWKDTGQLVNNCEYKTQKDAKFWIKERNEFLIKK